MDEVTATRVPTLYMSTTEHHDGLPTVQLALRQCLKLLSNWFSLWRKWQKRIFLCNLVENCGVRQLKLLVTALEPILHVDFTTTFPMCTTQSDSSLKIQQSLVRKLTQLSLKEYYDTHPMMINSTSSTDNIMTPGTSIGLAKDGTSPVDAIITTKTKTLIVGDGQETLLPYPLPQLHRRHRVSLGSSSYDSEDFYSFKRKNWFSSKSSHLHDHKKSKSLDSNVLIKPPVSHLTEQFKEQLSTVSKWMLEWNEQQVSWIYVQIVKMCDPELLVYLAQCLFQKMKTIPDIDRLPDKLVMNILQYLDMPDLCNASQVCHRWNRLCNDPSLWRHQCRLLGRSSLHLMNRTNFAGTDWKQTYKELYFQRGKTPVVLQADDEETDEGESESFVQQHITSAAIKAQMTLRSMIELVKGNCSLDDMATTQEVFHKAPESAAAIRRRLRAERKAEEQQKEVAMQPQTSRELLDELLLGDKSSFMVLTPIPEKVDSKKVEKKKKRTRLYPPSNPYSLVTVAADIRTAVTSMDTRDEGLRALTLSGCLLQEDMTPQPGVVEPIPLMKRILTESGAVLCVQWDVRKIVIGTAEQSIQVNDMRSGRYVATLHGHKGGVHCLQFDHNIIISGSWDRTCIVWDVVHFNIITELMGHTECVSCLKFVDSTLVTGSHDRTFKVWDLSTFSCTATVNAHQGPITCLDYVDDVIVTGATDKYVKVWSCDSYSLLGVMTHHHPVTALTVSKLLCISGTCEGTITFWNLESYTKLFSCTLADSPYVTSLSLSAAQCYAAGTNGLLYEIDLATTVCTRKLKGHSTSINKVQAGNSKIVTVSDDQTVCVWYKSGAVPTQSSPDGVGSEVEFHTLPVQVFQP